MNIPTERPRFQNAFRINQKPKIGLHHLLFTIYHSPRHQDKGHLNEIQEFAESIKNGSGYTIPLWQLIQATKISFEVEKRILNSQGNYFRVREEEK